MAVAVKNDDGSQGIAFIPVQLPHKVLQYLLSDCDLPIDDLLVMGYWQHLEEVGDEMALTSKSFRQMAGLPVVPLGVHGDDASMGLQNAPHEKNTGFMMNLPLYRPKSTRLSRFLIFSIENHKIWNLELTIYPLLAEVVKSLNLCTEVGVLGRRFLVTELRGDQSWYKYLFQHKSWWKSTFICFRCGASSKHPNNYVSYDGWVSSKRSTQQFLEFELPKEMCNFPELGQFDVLCLIFCC